jgi:hypothetical protein
LWNVQPALSLIVQVVLSVVSMEAATALTALPVAGSTRVSGVNRAESRLLPAALPGERCVRK